MRPAVYKQLLVVGVVVCLTLTVDDVQSDGSGSRSAHARHRLVDLTDEQKAVIVDYHNKLRRQEGSSNMELMTWSEALANKARLWAAKCVWEHGGEPLKAGESGIDYGQNLAMNTFTELDLTHGIQAWYDEKAGFDYATQRCDTSKVKMCGHYTQVVWATSRQVGCAYCRCETMTQTDVNQAAWYLVCNYLPAGNVNMPRKPYRNCLLYTSPSPRD